MSPPSSPAPWLWACSSAPRLAPASSSGSVARRSVCCSSSCSRLFRSRCCSGARTLPDDGTEAVAVSGLAPHGLEGHIAQPRGHAREHWISLVLRWGVGIAAAVILFGGIVFLIAGPAP